MDLAIQTPDCNVPSSDRVSSWTLSASSESQAASATTSASDHRNRSRKTGRSPDAAPTFARDRAAHAQMDRPKAT